MTEKNLEEEKLAEVSGGNNGIAVEYCVCPACGYSKCEITHDYDTTYFFCPSCGYDVWKR